MEHLRLVAANYKARAALGVAQNPYEIRGNHAVLFAYHKSTLLHEVTVDIEELDRVLAAGLWRVVTCDPKNNKLYAYRLINRKLVYLHRFVTDAPDGMLVDHRNHDGLDDRKINLRVCTTAQNTLNRKSAQSNSTSGFRGVDFLRGKWRARVRVNGKCRLLRYFDTPEQANAAVESKLREMAVTQ